MRFPVFLTVGLAVLTLGSGAAQAEPWWNLWAWMFPEKAKTREAQPFDRPHLEDAKTPQISQYAADDWTPQDWIESRGSSREVMNGFYRNGLITNMSRDQGVMNLEVGQNFMRLSSIDKKHVIAFVDYMYGVTKNNGGTILLTHKASGEPVGIYSSRGLQLQ